jgi:hypothetical protein
LIRAEAPTIVNASAPEVLGLGGGSMTPQGTTISQMSGEVAPKMPGAQPTLIHSPGESRRPGGLLVAGIAAGLLLVGGIGYVALRRPPAPPPGPRGDETQVAAERPAKPKVAHLQITSEPSGAEVKRVDTGEILGITPLDKDLVADGTLASIALHKDGYEDQRRAVRLTERDAALSFVLRPVAAPNQPPSPTTPASPGPTGTTRKPRPTGPRPSSHQLNDDILAPGR